MAGKASRAVRWYGKYSIDELQELQKKIEAENPAQPGVHYDGVWLYPKAVRAKFNDIAQAITWHLIDAKKAAGTYKEPDGYTGRNQNRR